MTAAGHSFQRKRDAVAAEVARMSAALVRPEDVDDALLAKLGQPLPRETHAFDLLRRPELGYGDLRVRRAAGGLRTGRCMARRRALG